MKPSASLTALIIALAAPITAALPEPAAPEPAAPEPAALELAQLPPPDADAWCTWNNPQWKFNYKVVIKEVDNVKKICDGLWAGLAKHRFFCSVGNAHCGEPENYPKGLEWSFTSGLTCKVGFIEASFWETTNNKFGALDTSGCQGP